MAKTLIGNIKGPKGDRGADGVRGPAGVAGATGPQGLDGDSAYQIAVNNGFEGSEEDWLASLEGGTFVGTITGTIATSTDSTDAPIISIKSNGYTKQDGTPTPDAPIEIEGLDKVSVKTCGKNLLKNIATTKTINGVTLTVNDDKSITANGTATAEVKIGVGNFKPKPNKTYIFTSNSKTLSDSEYWRAFSYIGNIDVVDTWRSDSPNNNYSYEFTPLTDTTLYNNIYIESGMTVNNLKFYPMIRPAEVTDDTYEPYTETLAEIDLTEPLYEGDYIEYRADGTGVLYRENGEYVLTEKDNVALSASSGYSPYFAIPATFIPTSTSVVVYDLISTHLKKGNPNDQEGNCILLLSTPTFKEIRLRVSGITTVDAMKTWLQSNPVTVVYKLATPQEIELTAEQLAQFKKLRTFEPTTNIISNGETTTQYYKANENGEAVCGLQERVDGFPDTYAKKSIYGDNAISFGRKSDTSVGTNSVAIGYEVTADGYCSYAEGIYTTAMGRGSHAEGQGTKALGDNSHAEGLATQALQNQHAQGHYNDTSLAKMNSDTGTSRGTAFVIGNGTDSESSNAFRVTGEGAVYAKSAYNSTGADYAEFAEWADGNLYNEDRRGYFVTYDEEKPNMIRIANDGDYILGVVSGNPCVIGNADEGWIGKYVFDDFGAFIYEEIEQEVEYADEETGEVVTKTELITTYKLNPDYDPEREYISRKDRQEWDYIGWIGVLSVRDDGTCVPGLYCKVADGGIATISERGIDTYRVLERVSENVIKVAIK